MAAYDFSVEQIVSVHDGDTCRLRVSQGFGASYTTDVRLLGIDTPELMLESKAAAIVARDAAKKWLTDNLKTIRLFSKSWDKYGGRALGEVYIEGQRDNTIAAFLISKGLAKPYDGGAKDPWTTEQLKAVEAYKV